MVKFKFSKSDIIVLIIAAMIVICSVFVIKPVIVKESSMEPTLQDGNFLLIDRVSKPKKGDIVIFKSDVDGGKLLVKRIIATDGEEIKVEDTSVYLNGEKLDEPYIKDQSYRYEENKSWDVPKDSIFVMGDNREVSLDSRYDQVGCVNKSKIVGKVLVRLYPFGEMGKVN